MLANRKLAFAISDVGFGEIKRQAQYKALLYGMKIVEAEQWFPSTKICSVCDYVNKDIQLSDREWACPKCGTKHDRDVNAAKNLKRLATASALPVASPAVMPSTAVVQTASGGKVTSVSYEHRPQEDSGQKERREHFCSQLE